MPDRDDLSLLIEAARSAGDVARAFSGATAQRWDKPDGAGPVTEADLAVDAHLHDVLRAARPGYGWLSEETEDDTARLSTDSVFIIDPIDGTRNFVEGGRTWAHSIAVARQGRVVAGVVYLPLRDKLYAAALGDGATLNGTPIRARDGASPDTATLLATKPSVDPRFWHGAVPGFDRAHRPSLAYRLALVAEGRFDGMLTFRPTWHWDIAAGSLIAAEAGAKVTDRAGQPLCFNTADPRSSGVIAALPPLHAALTKAHNPDA